VLGPSQIDSEPRTLQVVPQVALRGIPLLPPRTQDEDGLVCPARQRIGYEGIHEDGAL
jgi:hypothetical protein